MTITSLRPDRQTYDAGDLHWRGAQVWSINGANSTIRALRIGPDLVATQVVVTSMIPADAQSVGCPLCCRIDHTDMTTIVEIIGSTFADAPRGDNAASVARGEFRPGIVPQSITGEPRTWWEEA